MDPNSSAVQSLGIHPTTALHNGDRQDRLENADIAPSDPAIDRADEFIVVDGVEVPADADLSAQDVVAYINARFPTESSLETDLDGFISALRATIESHDTQLAEIVQAERHGGARSAHQVTEITSLLHTLESSVARVSTLSRAAGAAVEAATAEIRPLDAARRNIAQTAQALNDLVTLEDAVVRCETAAAADSTTALGELMASGDGTLILRQIKETVPTLGTTEGLVRVPELVARAEVVRETMRKAVVAEFKAALGGGARVGEMAATRLKGACAMADELEGDVRRDVLSLYVSARSQAYTKYFDKHPAELEQCDQRFAWLRTELRSFREAGWAAVFPSSWQVLEKVCETVLGLVRTVLTTQLKRQGGEDDVDLLLLVLQRAVDFERELDKFFSLGATKRVDIEEQETVTQSTFVGIVTSSFEAYMGFYVENEDRSLNELVDRLIREETWETSKENQDEILSSSTELFLQIKRTVRRCAALTTNKTFYDLHKVFKKYLKVYATALGKQVHQRRVSAAAPSQARTDHAGGESTRDGDEELLDRFVRVISTAEYCAHTVDQLEESLKKQMDPSFASDVNLSDERAAFVEVVSRGIRSVVKIAEIKVEPALLTMIGTNWGSLTEVGDSSAYVADIRSNLLRLAPVLKAKLSKPQYRVFCERFAKVFGPKIQTCLFRCRYRLNDLGAQQLLLDLATIKTILFEVANLGGSPTAAFNNTVNREMRRAEATLKVVLTPLPSVVDTYLTLVPDGSSTDLQKILELRGVPPARALLLVQDYARTVGVVDASLVAKQFQETAAARSPTSMGARPSTPATSRDLTSAGASDEGAVDSMRKLLGRLDISSQLEQTAGKLKTHFTT